MDRRDWLAERRAAVEQDYTRGAPTYDTGYDPATPLHIRYVGLLIERSPEGGTILDAACGTGPYVYIVLRLDAKWSVPTSQLAWWSRRA